MKKLNLGCGGDIKKGYINLDMRKAPGVDIVHDLNKFPYPFEDNEFDEIVAYNILEHVDNMLKTMEELHRILKQGGKLDIITPHYNGPMAWGNPEHRRGYGHDTFFYFVKGYAGKEKYTEQQFSRCRAKLLFGKKFQIWNWIVEPIANLFPHFYEDTPFSIFPAQGVRAILIK